MSEQPPNEQTTEHALVLDRTEHGWWPGQKPRDAATLILVDRSASAPKVLLGRRHDSHKFLPGKFVFPGGRAEPADRRMPFSRPLNPRVEARLMLQCRRPSAVKARALALAAIRETAEETGILLGKKPKNRVTSPGNAWALFAELDVLPDLGDLHFIARAITPPGRPKRFDTRFFVADASAIAHRVENVVGPDTELVELVWMTIAETERLDLAPVTRAVLRELERRTAAGLSHDLPVPFYRILHRRFHSSWLP